MNRYIKLILGICISLIGLYFAFSGIDFDRVTNIHIIGCGRKEVFKGPIRSHH